MAKLSVYNNKHVHTSVYQWRTWGALGHRPFWLNFVYCIIPLLHSLHDVTRLGPPLVSHNPSYVTGVHKTPLM